MKVPLLRLRFTYIIKHMSVNNVEFEELSTYQTNKVQEDLRFLDDVKWFVLINYLYHYCVIVVIKKSSRHLHRLGLIGWIKSFTW